MPRHVSSLSLGGERPPKAEVASGPRLAVAMWLLALCSVSACVAAPPSKPLGELPAFGWGPRFDAQSVRSQAMGVSRRKDGTWAGTVGGEVVEIDVGDHHLLIAGKSRARVDWEETAEGLLVTRAGIEKFLVISCAENDRECSYSPKYLNEQDEVDHLCAVLGCHHVLHWRPTIPERGPDVVVPLLIALFAGS
jgi:hypothetical protein